MARKAGAAGASKSGTVAGMEENLKKAVTEMLVLSLLGEREMYTGELLTQINRRSAGIYSVGFPYALIYRMEKFGYLEESGKRMAEDGRRRQYYRITPAGRGYLEKLVDSYERLTCGVHFVLHPPHRPGGGE